MILEEYLQFQADKTNACVSFCRANQITGCVKFQFLRQGMSNRKSCTKHTVPELKKPAQALTVRSVCSAG